MTVHDLPEAMLDWLAARCSNAGRWGSSDCMGTLNRITPAVRGKAAALVSAGSRSHWVGFPARQPGREIRNDADG